MKDLHFAKGQALGNDYLIVEEWPQPASLLAQRICDRQHGPGSDGLLLADTKTRPFRLTILNPDGSEAEKSGNGLRIFGAYLHGKGLVGGEAFIVQLATDTAEMQVESEESGGVLDIRVDIGRATFGDVNGEELTLNGGQSAVINRVSVGNPHCVVFLEHLERVDFLNRAPQLAVHDAFTHGTNVQFAHVVSDDRIEAWIWERGAGETLASGSSASAVAAAARRTNRVGAPKITVVMPGGNVEVEVSDDYFIRLHGPAQMVYTGIVRSEVVDAWLSGGG